MFDSMFPSHWTTLRKLMWLKLKGASAVWDTISGNPVSFSARSAPLRQLKVAFSPVQSLNGYDAPWPAGGGKNLRGDLPLAQDFAARFTSGTLDTTNKTFTFPYNTTEANEPLPSAPTFEENTQYTFILTMKNDGIGRTNLQVLYTDGTSSYFGDLSGAGVKQTVALVSTAGKTVKTLARRQQGGATIVYYEESGVFKGVLTASQFTPYSNLCPISGWDELTVYHSGADTSDPQTVTVTIGQTVYGGTLDVVTGVVTVDMAEADLNDLNWSNTQYSAEGRGVFYSALADAKVYAFASKADCLSEKYATNAINDVISHPNCIGIGNKQVWCSTNSSETTPTGKLVYELAEPLTIQLTPQEVQSLLGENVVWSDANGDLTITYRSN